MDKYRDCLKFLYSLQKYGIKFGLSCTENILSKMGNPHLGKNYIHIAGTNGKGSVANFIVSILKEAGYKVGLYTSPHLVRFTERIQINFQEISQKEVIELVNDLNRAIAPEEPPTFFEAVTAMALNYFAKKQTDISVIEVGMGGRLDATNIITPLISIITQISYDHQQFLGKSLMEIGYEKAGIIKDGVPVVTGIEHLEVLGLIKSICEERQSKLFCLGKDFVVKIKNGTFEYKGLYGDLYDLKISLKGKHQYKNAALALASIELLIKKGWDIKPSHISKGLESVKWPGRLQIISNNPLIVLDGAHNPEAMKMLCESLEKEFKHERLIVVLGIMSDKDIKTMLKEIVPKADQVIFTSPKYERSADPRLLLELSKGFNVKMEAITPLPAAIDKAISIASNKDLILICGSLFTVGEALSYFKPKEYKPEF